MSNDSTIFERLLDQKLVRDENTSTCEAKSICAGMFDNVHTAHPADCWHGNTYRQHCEQKNTYFYFQKNIFTSLKISMKSLDMFPMIPSRHDPGAVLVCQLQLQRHRPEQPQAGQVHCDRAPHSPGKY